MSTVSNRWAHRLLDGLLAWWLPADSEEDWAHSHETEARYRAQYHAQRRQQHAERVPLEYCVFLFFGTFATVLELVAYPARLRFILLAYITFALIATATIVLIRVRPQWTTVVSVVSNNALILCTAAYYIPTGGVPEACALTLVLFMTALPLLNAAGPGVQALSCTGAVIGYPLILLAGAEPILPVSYGITGILGATGVTAFGAYLLDRQRYAAFRGREALRTSEERLRGMGERYRTLYEHNPAMYFTLDADGTVRSVNRFGAEQLGHRIDELEARSVSAIVQPADRSAFASQLARCVDGGEATHWEFRAVRKDGSVLWAKASARAVADRHGRMEVFLVCDDVTARKQMEEATRQHQAELAHVARVSLMGEMAAGLAHEINQPLGAIVNFTHGCERRLRARGSTDTDVLHTLEQVSGQAMRAGQIIRRIRDFIRKEEPSLEWVDVNELVRHVAELAEPEGRQHGITLEVNLAPAIPRAYGNGIQIEQVLLNLVRNGFDAMEGAAHGARTLSIHTGTPEAARIEVAVSDTGPGLAPDLIDRIFDPFFSTKASGLGLGLSISRSIIEAHGGRLWADPNSASGSTFRFSLTGEPC